MRKAKIGILAIVVLAAVAITNEAPANSKHRTTLQSVVCKENYAFSSPVSNLSGIWVSNVGGKYYVRQVGTCLWWVGLGTYNATFDNYSYANLFLGAIHQPVSGISMVKGSWFDDPKAGGPGFHGQLSIKVSSPTAMSILPTAGFPGISWTKSTTTYGGLAKAAAVWRCDDSASPSPNYLPTDVYQPSGSTFTRFDVIQVGRCVVFWARPKISPKPNSGWQWSSVFFGESTGSGSSEAVHHGPWADVPAGQVRERCGNMDLTAINLTAGHFHFNVGPGGTATGACLTPGAGPFGPLGLEHSP